MNEKHLEFIQATIERMAKHSFQAKAWGITTASAVSGFLITEVQVLPFLAFMLPIALLLIFGTLDAYYLYLERGYRCLYNAVIKSGNQLNISDFDMNIPASGRGYKKFCKVVWSKTIGGFYVSIIALMVIFFCFFTKG